MIKKLLAIALAALLPLAGAAKVYAEDPPADPEVTTAPEDPDAQPYPPDGVTDPNAVYPTDGAEGTDQGETAAPPPADGASPDVAAPDAEPSDAQPSDAPPPDAASPDAGGGAGAPATPPD